MQIAIIGCGNMGMAYARSFIKYNIVKNEDLFLLEKNVKRADVLKAEGFKNVSDVFDKDVFKQIEIIVIAVKPQDFDAIAPYLKDKINENTLVLSIMAGQTIDKISSSLNHTKVVRAMPNAPAQIGMGITAYAVHKSIDLQMNRKIENLLNATGRSLLLENESLLNAVTAISGSGPAYFYYFLNSMTKAAHEIGLSETESMMLIKQTMLGTFHLLNHSGKPFDELISEVASKGGTTEAALKVFNDHKMNDAIVDGIKAANKRSEELSK